LASLYSLQCLPSAFCPSPPASSPPSSMPKTAASDESPHLLYTAIQLHSPLTLGVSQAFSYLSPSIPRGQTPNPSNSSDVTQLPPFPFRAVNGQPPRQPPCLPLTARVRGRTGFFYDIWTIVNSPPTPFYFLGIFPRSDFPFSFFHLFISC